MLNLRKIFTEWILHYPMDQIFCINLRKNTQCCDILKSRILHIKNHTVVLFKACPILYIMARSTFTRKSYLTYALGYTLRKLTLISLLFIGERIMIVTISDDFDLQKISDSGQCFRSRQIGDFYRYLKLCIPFRQLKSWLQQQTAVFTTAVWDIDCLIFRMLQIK